MALYRERSRSEGPLSETCVKTLNGAFYSQTTDVVHDRREVIEDYVTPDFQARIAEGAVINNPCLYEVSSRTVEGRGTYYASRPGYMYATTGGSITLFQDQTWHLCKLITSVEPVLNIDKAKFHAWTNVDASPHAFLEDTFEIRETLRFLRNPLNGMYKLSKAFKKKVRLAHRKKYSRNGSARPDTYNSDLRQIIADAWLQDRFAFGPLLRSSMELVDEWNSTKQWRVPPRRTSRGFDFEEIPEKVEYIRSYYSPTVYDDFKRSTTWVKSWKASILYEVTNPLMDLKFLLGLRIKDIPETIWAVTPYSFMVDRILNISKTIRGMTNVLDPQVRILAASTRLKNEGQTKTTFVGQVNPPNSVTVYPDTVVDKSFVYDRQVWVPSVSDTMPTPEWGGLVKDLTKTADLFALVYRNLLCR